MVIFADFNNILPSKIFCMQGKVPNGEIHPSFTLPELPQDRSMYGGDEGGLVIKTHLRNFGDCLHRLARAPEKNVK